MPPAASQSPVAKQYDEKTDSGWSSQDESETAGPPDEPLQEYHVNRPVRTSVSSSEDGSSNGSEHSYHSSPSYCAVDDTGVITGNSAAKQDYYFSAYTWLSDKEASEARMMAQILKDDDDLEELYYWDAVRGCDGDACGRSKVMAYRKEQERQRDAEIDEMRATYEETMTLRQQYMARNSTSSRRGSSHSDEPAATEKKKQGCGYTFLADARNIPAGVKTCAAAPYNRPVYFDVVYEDRTCLNPGAQSFIPRK